MHAVPKVAAQHQQDGQGGRRDHDGVVNVVLTPREGGGIPVRQQRACHEAERSQAQRANDDEGGVSHNICPNHALCAPR